MHLFRDRNSKYIWHNPDKLHTCRPHNTAPLHISLLWYTYILYMCAHGATTIRPATRRTVHGTPKGNGKVSILLWLFTSSHTTTTTSTIMTDNNNHKKTIYLIRHAQSEENRRMASLTAALSAVGRFSVPRASDVGAALHLLHVSAQVDSSVSAVGAAQIQNVAAQLHAADFWNSHRVSTVVHSPLQRAVDTCQGLLEGPPRGEDATTSTAATTTATTTTTTIQPPHDMRIESLDILREKTPAEWLPGNAASLRQRLDALQDYLAALPATECVVCVVGHSQYFQALLNLSYKFGNCDVYRVEFDGATPRGRSAAKDVLPPQWSGLERVFECTVDVTAMTEDAETDNADT